MKYLHRHRVSPIMRLMTGLHAYEIDYTPLLFSRSYLRVANIATIYIICISLSHTIGYFFDDTTPLLVGDMIGTMILSLVTSIIMLLTIFIEPFKWQLHHVMDYFLGIVLILLSILFGQVVILIFYQLIVGN